MIFAGETNLIVSAEGAKTQKLSGKLDRRLMKLWKEDCVSFETSLTEGAVRLSDR